MAGVSKTLINSFDSMLHTTVTSNQSYKVSHVDFINTILYLQNTSCIFLHCSFHNSQISIKGSNTTIHVFVDTEWTGGYNLSN